MLDFLKKNQYPSKFWGVKRIFVFPIKCPNSKRAEVSCAGPKTRNSGSFAKSTTHSLPFSYVPILEPIYLGPLVGSE